MHFPDMDLSGTWDMGMQMHPHFFVTQPVDEMPPIPEVMPGVDVPLNSPLLPLRGLPAEGGQKLSHHLPPQM